MAIKKIVLVGHCGADTGTLDSVLRGVDEKIPVETAHTDKEVEKAATPDALLLVNRVLDGRFMAEGGIELIAALAKKAKPPAMMLISNYPEAQAEAVKAGAQLGFGKSNAFDESTAKLLRKTLGVSEPAKKKP